jgi:hypothetical protein
MILDHLGYIDLPPHVRKSGFDHAACRRGEISGELMKLRARPIKVSLVGKTCLFDIKEKPLCERLFCSWQHRLSQQP